MALSCDDDLTLEGADVVLPTLEEQAAKREKALTNLRSYVESCRGTLSEDWDCVLRCRITTRRHGRRGLTTDNFYQSPCGQTFRTHKQVVDFLGLQPVTKEQPQQQQREEDLPVGSVNILSVTLLDASGSPISSAATASTQSGHKRSHSAMTATDDAAAADTPAAAVAAAANVDISPAACPPPVSAVSDSSQAATSSHLHCSISSNTSSQQGPFQHSNRVKRTKAALMAKYAAHQGTPAVSTATATTPAAAAAAAAKAGGVAAASGMHSGGSTATWRGFSCQATTSTAAAAPSLSCDTPAAAAAAVAPVRSQQPLQQQPAASTHSVAGASTTRSSSEAVSSKLAARSAPPAAPVGQQQWQQQQQQGQRVVQPVPKWKPRKPVAWRAQLRELATKAAMEQGLIPSPNSSGSPGS